MIRLLEKKIRLIAKLNSIRIIIPFIFLIPLFVVSCSKPAGTIGIEIQPEDTKLNLNYTDTTTLYAYSEPIDSIRSDYLAWNGIGSLKDPIFGHTNVGFYTQFSLSKTGQEFGENRVLDSLVLQLDYYGTYGDTNTVNTAHIYQLAEGLETETVYYSSLDLDLYPPDYGNISFLSRPNDSVVVGEDTIAPLLRFNLSKNNPQLAEYLLNATIDEMEDSDIFKDFFKGLYIIAEPVNESGCIATFDLTSSRSKMTLYFSNEEAQDIQFDYLISTGEARVSKYEHDFSTADPDFQQQVVNGDTTLGGQKYYVQGFGGVKSIIKVPYIDEWKNLGIISFNEVKLVLNGYEPEPLWGAPYQIALYSIDADGNDQFLIDYEEGDTYFGGFYKASSNNYTFRITRYMQSLVTNPDIKHYGFSLYVTSPWLTPNRFIFNGNESDSTAIIRMETLYTDLN